MASARRLPPLENDVILRAARGDRNIPHTPVWIMRQAGRYLPEFRAMRAEQDFFTVCRTPSLAAEITLQPVRRYPLLDAAVIFSDILVIPQALGLEVQMIAGRGPVFPAPLRTLDDLRRLRAAPNPTQFATEITTELNYVYDAIRLTVALLAGRIPVIGFTGAPWTLFAYMIEGGGSHTWAHAKRWLLEHPTESHTVLQLITDACVAHLVAQARAGARLLQVFDSWADALSPAMFREFAAPYLGQIHTRVQAELARDFSDYSSDDCDRDGHRIPMILFAKGAHIPLAELEALGYSCLGLDWTEEAATVRDRLQRRDRCVQGNLDPCLLFAPESVLRLHVEKLVADLGPTAHIANLGHGLTPEHTPEQVGRYLELVREISTRVLGGKQQTTEATEQVGESR